MPVIRIETASAVPWNDVEHAFTGGGDGASCWCQWYLMKRSEFDSATRADKRDRLRDEIDVTTPSPGLVIFVDGSAAGWVRVGPRTSQGRLTRARVVRAGSPESLDDPDVWGITCLVVRREYRGQGLAKRLVAAAVEHATENGARLIEAYPFDTEQRKTSNNEMFVGSVHLFREQHFTVTSRPTAARVVMTRSVIATDAHERR